MLRSRVGVSWVSVDAACQFANEIEDYDLNQTVSAAVQNWEDSVFSTIQIADTSNVTLLEMFYSAMYHSHLMPSNRTGESPYWETDEPVFDDYCKCHFHLVYILRNKGDCDTKIISERLKLYSQYRSS